MTAIQTVRREIFSISRSPLQNGAFDNIFFYVYSTLASALNRANKVVVVERRQYKDAKVPGNLDFQSPTVGVGRAKAFSLENVSKIGGAFRWFEYQGRIIHVFGMFYEHIKQKAARCTYVNERPDVESLDLNSFFGEFCSAGITSDCALEFDNQKYAVVSEIGPLNVLQILIATGQVELNRLAFESLCAQSSNLRIVLLVSYSYLTHIQSGLLNQE